MVPCRAVPCRASTTQNVDVLSSPQFTRTILTTQSTFTTTYKDITLGGSMRYIENIAPSVLKFEKENEIGILRMLSKKEKKR